MTMPIIALFLSLAFTAYGLHATHSSGGLGGMPAFVLVLIPGVVGLILACVALLVFWIPATSGWAWLPSVLSYIATLSMVTWAGVMNLVGLVENRFF